MKKQICCLFPDKYVWVTCPSCWETDFLGLLIKQTCHYSHVTGYETYEPPRGKTNNVVPSRFDTNRAVQAQEIDKSLKFWI